MKIFLSIFLFIFGFVMRMFSEVLLPLNQIYVHMTMSETSRKLGYGLHQLVILLYADVFNGEMMALQDT